MKMIIRLFNDSLSTTVVI